MKAWRAPAAMVRCVAAGKTATTTDSTVAQPRAATAIPWRAAVRAVSAEPHRLVLIICRAVAIRMAGRATVLEAATAAVHAVIAATAVLHVAIAAIVVVRTDLAAAPAGIAVEALAGAAAASMVAEADSAAGAAVDSAEAVVAVVGSTVVAVADIINREFSAS